MCERQQSENSSTASRHYRMDSSFERSQRAFGIRSHSEEIKFATRCRIRRVQEAREPYECRQHPRSFQLQRCRRLSNAMRQYTASRNSHPRVRSMLYHPRNGLKRERSGLEDQITKRTALTATQDQPSMARANPTENEQREATATTAPTTATIATATIATAATVGQPPQDDEQDEANSSHSDEPSEYDRRLFALCANLPSINYYLNGFIDLETCRRILKNSDLAD